MSKKEGTGGLRKISKKEMTLVYRQKREFGVARFTPKDKEEKKKPNLTEPAVTTRKKRPSRRKGL